jgi:hypothetical protein
MMKDIVIGGIIVAAAVFIMFTLLKLGGTRRLTYTKQEMLNANAQAQAKELFGGGMIMKLERDMSPSDAKSLGSDFFAELRLALAKDVRDVKALGGANSHVHVDAMLEKLKESLKCKKE